mmetsp:Transcript_8061/g.23091  ORF Transcript_8061/g.23091 Transcript_8061/m.23091 type:complete len:959 (-) Transcript_8061:217-3093(-)|eukprot:CAMPEP_0117670328 /NCGR_PEP_ID=MMETSP0804-20121206/12682_1 /TAXON_ID=1074897 /ORGANISM="Tetraselmis astigmatica, Strain CCMP880" /LENGTH=958 /DNA_ID=CAMNT_0005478595 /DNA_START=105 /DNA_END=2981 /DNA_ORIENTATION=-
MDSSKQWSARLTLLLIATVVGFCVFDTNSGFQKGLSKGASVMKPYVIPDPALHAGNQGSTLWGDDRRSKLSPRFMERFLQQNAHYGSYDYYYTYAPAPAPAPAPEMGIITVSVKGEVLEFSVKLLTYTAADLIDEAAVASVIQKTRAAFLAAYLEAFPEASASDYKLSVTELDGSNVDDVCVTIELDFGAGDLSSKEGRKAAMAWYNKLTSDGDQASAADLKEKLDKELGEVEFKTINLRPDETYTPSDGNFYGFYGAVPITVSRVFFTVSTGGEVPTEDAVFDFVEDVVTDLAITSSPEVTILSLGTASDGVAKFTDDVPGATKFASALQGTVETTVVSPFNVTGVSVETSTLNPVWTEESSGMSSGHGSSSGFYGFYGSSSSFYGFYGSSSSEVMASSGGFAVGSSGAGVGSSGAGVGSSSATLGSSGGAFYGYKVSTPSRPTARESDSSSTAPGWSTNNPGKGEPATGNPTAVEKTLYPVYFTSVLSDYNMEDLYNGADLAQFRADYISAIDNAISLLGITSDPSVTIQNVLPASVAVPTVVTFVDDPNGAEILADVLKSNPALAFPAFSGLGSITIVDVSTGHSTPYTPGDGTPVDPWNGQSGSVPPPETCPTTRSGDTCCLPAELDAKNDCCWQGVDECGVCAGSSNTCATLATVRIAVSRPGLTADISTPEFADMVADFKADFANLFAQFNVGSGHITVDTDGITSQQGENGVIEFDIPFRIDPDLANNVAAPTLTNTRAILVAAAEEKAEADGMTVIGVLNVARGGVCGNSECEIGEFVGHTSYSASMSCAADCPGFKSCPIIDGNVCSGNGGCNSDVGECKCSAGYTGSDCATCAAGYQATVAGKCVIPGSGEQISPPGSSPAQENVDPSSVPPSQEEGSDGSDTSVILGAVFGVIACVLIGLGCYYVFVIRKRNEANRDVGLGFICEEQPVASREEPDIPTRQLTESTV